MDSRLRYLSQAGLLLAGLVHLMIAPEHFAHTPAHGLFFGLIGVAQILWAVVSFWSHNPLTMSGIILSGGMVIVWALAHYVAMPFAATLHPLDATGATAKLAELIAFAALVLSYTPTRLLAKRSLPWRLLSQPVPFSLLSGGVIWGVSLALAPLLPGLAEGPNHHGNPFYIEASGRSTSAYFSIVNSGASDTLVSLSGEGIGAITLHRTTVDSQDIARMQGLDEIVLKPHTRFDFSPSSNHVMLDELPRDLYEGDSVILTLHFASGRSIEAEFAVRVIAPEERINFVTVEGFQITNAWIRATASQDGLVSISEGAYEWQLPQGFPLPRVPENNPMTNEKVALGQHLFYDTRLSGSGTQSCSSCHLQALAFTDGQALPTGSTGDIHPRNSLTLVNSAYNATLTWANPNLLTLERQILIPMFGEHPVELGITGYEEVVLERFLQDDLYRGLFTAAYPAQDDPFTFNNISLALSSFTRTLISGNSAYDRYVRGETTALSESAQRGMALFFSEGLECHHCHTGFNFTLSTVTANTTFEESPFFNTGLYNIGGTGAYPADNTGLYEITNNPADMGRFRPPTLREIALTAPYMHDGSLATLEEVIQFYQDGGRVTAEGEYAGDGRANPYKNGLVPGFNLTDQEASDLVEFLKSLTDEEFITDSRFRDPFVEVAAENSGG